MKIRVIVNPKAGAGSAARKVSEIRRALKSRGVSCDIVETRGAGDATRLARTARIDEVEVLAVVGGDGTVNEVSQAYVDDEGAPLAGRISRSFLQERGAISGKPSASRTTSDPPWSESCAARRGQSTSGWWS